MSEIKWKVIPQKQVGKIQFSMGQKEVRTILGPRFKALKKSLLGKSRMDAYADYHVFYDKAGKVEAIELFRGVDLVLNEKKIFPGSVNSIKQLANDFEYRQGSLISKSLSIGVTVSDDDTTLESILLGCKNYYN